MTVNLEEDGIFTSDTIALHGTETFTHVTMTGRLDNGHAATLDLYFCAPIPVDDWPQMLDVPVMTYALEEVL